MHFPFLNIATLLSRLETIEVHDPPLLPTEKSIRYKDAIAGWFKSHRRAIDALEVHDGVALLSSLLPEWRTDRVYNLQSPRLCKRIGRVLRLSSDKQRRLEAYRTQGHGDLAECLARVLESNGPPALPPVQLAEVDRLFQQLSDHCHFSEATTSRPQLSSSPETDRLLENLLCRMLPLEAKCLVRLILKGFSPVRMDEQLVFKNHHFLLPDLLQFQRHFSAALALLHSEFKDFHASPDAQSARLLRVSASKRLRPVVGIKVGRPNFYKARGIDHCMSMLTDHKAGMVHGNALLSSQRWVLDRKYDGEYCEIHVDLENCDSPDPASSIRIFSKSGKNSTEDRKSLHQAIVTSLGLGKPDCRIANQAIILGELVAFSDDEGCVMPFENIRRRVTRSGRYIGTNQDSAPPSSEHLAIVFFDILLRDDEIIMRKSIEERRSELKKTCRQVPGHAWRSEWQIVDFANEQRSKAKLVEHFAMSIARRHEGLILKPCGVPYIPLSNEYAHSYIKLKKDLIGLGDEADFPVIGASYDAQLASASSVQGVKWTSFHLGCLINDDDVRRFGARPKFKYMGTIGCGGQCIPKSVLEAANILCHFEAESIGHDERPAPFEVIHSGPKQRMDILLQKPFVFEVLGSKFAKPPDCNFYMLSFPRVKKLHQDRSFLDCPSFQGIQEQAEHACSLPDIESQETREWMEKLQRQCKRKVLRIGTASPASRKNATPSRLSPSKSINLVNHHSSKGLLTPLPSSGARQTTGDIQNPQENVPDVRSFGKRHCDLVEDVVPARCKKAKSGHQGGNKERVKTCCRSQRRSPLSEISYNSRFKQMAKKLSSFSSTYLKSVSGRSSAKRCIGASCLFYNAVIYVVPCIATMLYVVDDLLPSHRITLSADLCHWDRDSFTHPALTETVSESQSHPGLRKVVLVEKKRTPAVEDLIRCLERMNEGKFRERIDVFDWRVLEDCSNHDRTADVVTRHFLGATMFDESQGRTLFIRSATHPG